MGRFGNGNIVIDADDDDDDTDDAVGAVDGIEEQC
jgi:hypothetical protein